MTSTTMRRPLIVLLFLVASVTHAEGNCPPGYYPTGAPQGQTGPQGCVPIPNYNQEQQQSPIEQPPARWVSRWGAVATDGPAGILGAATNLANRNQAEQEAMADCKSKGGANCKIDTSYGNQCATVVVGSKGYTVNLGATIDAAIQKGMKTCVDTGGNGCHIYYSDCSLPVRIQ